MAFLFPPEILIQVSPIPKSRREKRIFIRMKLGDMLKL